MRYDKKIIFQLVTEVYKDNGDYSPNVESEHTEYGSIVATDIDTMRLVYGEIREGSLTFSLQNKVDYDCNRLLIDGKQYSVDARIKQRVKESFVVSEV